MTFASASGSCSRATPNTSAAASPSTACSTDPSGRYACLYKRWHLIGLEVGISVASVGLRGEPTGCPTGLRADAVATAKRDAQSRRNARWRGRLHRGREADAGVRRRCASVRLPLGLAHGVKLCSPVAAGQPVRWATWRWTPPALRLRCVAKWKRHSRSASKAHPQSQVASAGQLMLGDSLRVRGVSAIRGGVAASQQIGTVHPECTCGCAAGDRTTTVHNNNMTNARSIFYEA